MSNLKKSKSRLIAILLTSTALSLISSIAVARDDNIGDDKSEPAIEATLADAAPPREDDNNVVVTARRRSEALQNVPIAVSAVSGVKLASQHLDRVADFAAKVPNFSALQQNPRVSSTSIRGIGGNANNDGVESGVGLIVDNVFLTHIGFSWNDFTDLEGIEVVRGPQGTLLGKNTTVGAVIIKTKGPTFDPEYKAELTLGNNDRVQTRLSASGPVIDNILAYRFSVGYDKADGWINNNYNNDKYLDVNRSSVRGQLLFTPNENIKSRLIIDHLESSEYNNFYPTIGDANYNLNLDGSVYTTSANPTGVRSSYTNVLKSVFGYNLGYYDLDTSVPNNANSNTQGTIDSKIDGVSNEINWAFNGLNLTSVTAWRKFHFRPHNDADGTPYSILRAGYDVDVSQYSQEFRLANDIGSKLDWQAGVYYLREDLNSTNRIITYDQASKFFFAAYPALAANSAILDGVEFRKVGRVWTKSAAAFGQITWHVTDKADLTAGLRYTSETKEVDVTGSYSGGSTLPAALAAYRAALAASLNGTYSALGGTFNIYDKKTQDSVSWLINPSYKLNDNVLLYALASYGEKSGAANTTASPVTASFTIPLIIEPEKSTDFEAGFKSSWFDKKLVVNLNLFHNKLENYQTSQVNTATLYMQSYLANAAEVLLQGVELETAYTPIKGLNFNFSVGYNDAKFEKYEDAPTPVELSAAVGSTLSLSGYRVTGVPKINAQAGVDFVSPVNDTLEAFGYLNLSYRSKTPLYNPRSTIGWQDAYTIANVGVGLRRQDRKYSVLLWAKNLTDERYLVGVGSAGTVNGYIGVLGDPLTAGVTFSTQF